MSNHGIMLVMQKFLTAPLFLQRPISFLKPENRNTLKSIFWILLWASSYTLLMTVAKLLSTDISTVVLVFIRLFFGLSILSPFIFKKSGIANLKTTKFTLHGLRAILVSATMLCTYYSCCRLPLAIATSIGFTGPLITVAFSILLLKEQFSLKRWGLVIIGYIGVIIIVNPNFSHLQPAMLVALLGNLLATLAIIIAKKLSNTESPTTILLYSTFLSFIMMGLFAYFEWRMPVKQDLILLFFLGILGIFSQFCYLSALKIGKPSFLAPFEYTRLIFAIPLGFFLFDEVLLPSTMIGILIIIVTTYYLVQDDFKEKKESIL